MIITLVAQVEDNEQINRGYLSKWSTPVKEKVKRVIGGDTKNGITFGVDEH